MLVRNAQLQVISTQPLLARLLEDTLHTRLPDFPACSLVVDCPVGFAFQVITPASAGTSFVLTQNACTEYLDDLWNLGVLGLAYRSRTLEELAELLRRAETQERVRLTPTQRSPLTPAESSLLRLVARGLANKEIARELKIADQTVQNGLTRVFQKLGCRGRSEAILYYWGINLQPEESRWF